MKVNKWQLVFEKLRGMEKPVVAFSGGVDSSLLLAVANDVLKGDVTALTFDSPLLPKSELRAAEAFAKELGVRHEVIVTDELSVDTIRANNKDRCYLCKKCRFEQAIRWADENGMGTILEGSNCDDKMDFRPGMRILTELSPRLISPFIEADITKSEIRELAKKRNLSVWNKPSAACLASRIEYDTALSVDRLEAVEKAEDYLRQFVTGQLRVRSHGMIARIEVGRNEMPLILEKSAEINRTLKKLGFLYVALDIEGYRQGSQNEIFTKARFS